MFLVLPIFNFSSNASIVNAELKTIEPVDTADEKSVNDLFLYNVYLSGNHFADSGTEEGAMAIKGNTTIPELNTKDGIAAAFDYASIFNAANKEPLRGNLQGQWKKAEHKTAMLLGGKYSNFGTGYINFGTDLSNTLGWLVVPDNSSWANNMNTFPSKLGFYGSMKTLKTSQIEGSFSQLDKTLGIVQKQFNLKIAAIKNLSTSQLKIIHTDAKGNNVNIFASVYDSGSSKIAVIDLDDSNNMDLQIDGESRYLPTFHLPSSTNTNNEDAFLKDAEYDQIIIYSSKTNFIFNDNRTEWGDNVLAQKFTYYLPNANQVTSFSGKNSNSSVIPELPSEKELSGENGVNPFLEKKDEYDFSASEPLMGSLIAPNATLALSASSINGYTWVKNLYQLNGSDIHNFYNPFLSRLGRIHVVKKELDTERRLKSVGFELLNKTTNTVSQLWTDENGEAYFEDLLPGKYELAESPPLEGYLKSTEKWVINVDGNYQVTLKKGTIGSDETTATPMDISNGEIEIYNQKDIKATFGKIDSLTNVKLKAEFSIDYENKQSEDVPSDIKNAEIEFNDKTGQYEINNLRLNHKYRITETKAPDGYEKLDPEKDYWILQVDAEENVTIEGYGKAANLFVNKNPETKEPTDKDTTENSETKETDFDLKNDQTPIPLPQTGGHGTLNYWIVGIILLIFGGIAISIRLRDRRWSKWTS